MIPSPYVTAAEAADYLRFASVAAFRQFRYRRRQAGFPIPAKRVGRCLRFRISDLEAAMSLECEPPRRVNVLRRKRHRCD